MPRKTKKVVSCAHTSRWKEIHDIIVSTFTSLPHNLNKLKVSVSAVRRWYTESHNAKCHQISSHAICEHFEIFKEIEEASILMECQHHMWKYRHTTILKLWYLVVLNLLIALNIPDNAGVIKKIFYRKFFITSHEIS